MDKPVVMENAMDFIKLGTATAAPVGHLVFGIPLQDWMYIFSIIASLFYILDKLPAIVRRIHGWVQRKKCNSGCSYVVVDVKSSE